jgi:prepilin-type processing-associated H-X9-DG protein
MKTARSSIALNLVVILVSIAWFAFVQRRAQAARQAPLDRGHGGGANVQFVDTQRDVYGVYRALRIRGMRIVHLNRFFNVAEYMPSEFTRSSPFPLSLSATAALYERGVESHTWLYVATRTGMVRGLVTVLPGSVFRERLGELRSDPDFTYRSPMFEGYSYDTQRGVTTIDALPHIAEPVIVNVDAGYFIDGTPPAEVVAALQGAFTDIRSVVLVRSLDEQGVDAAMLRGLETFGSLWRGQGQR